MKDTYLEKYSVVTPAKNTPVPVGASIRLMTLGTFFVLTEFQKNWWWKAF